jgi:hypothetical protein
LALRNILDQIPRDRGLLHTLACLARRPGHTIEGYLDGRRAEFFNPLNLLTLTAGLTALFYSNHSFDLSPLLTGFPPDQLEIQSRVVYFQFKYRALMQVLTLPLMAAITLVLFAGRRRGYAEHLVINAFLMSTTNLLYVLFFFILLYADRSHAFGGTWQIGSAVLLAYRAFVLYAVFARSGGRASTALKALAATAAAAAAQVGLISALATLLFTLGKS